MTGCQCAQEVSERLKEHAWKVCKRFIPLHGFDNRLRIWTAQAGLCAAARRTSLMDETEHIPPGARTCDRFARGEVSERLKRARPESVEAV